MKIRLIPKIRFVNYRKAFPNASPHCWVSWFRVNRMWRGKLVTFHIRAVAMELDFRRNWVADMIER